MSATLDGGSKYVYVHHDFGPLPRTVSVPPTGPDAEPPASWVEWLVRRAPWVIVDPKASDEDLGMDEALEILRDWHWPRNSFLDEFEDEYQPAERYGVRHWRD